MNLVDLHVGDMRAVLAGLAAASVDAVVTDPPYELGFMGAKWDGTGIAFDVETWRACLRVAKPGAHLVAFGGTRTSHRMVCAIEDAGWEIRDSIIWLYGSGMPKSLNLRGAHEGKGTALKPGHEPICVARKPLGGTVLANVETYGTGALNIDASRVAHASAADLQQHRDGVAAIKARGGIMKNSWKNSSDLSGASDVKAAGRWPANVVLTHGVECRKVGTRKVRGSANSGSPAGRTRNGTMGDFSGAAAAFDYVDADGNETFDAWDCAPGCPVAEMDRQSGELQTHAGNVTSNMAAMGFGGGPGSAREVVASRGGASRFFHTFELDAYFIWCAKASAAERGDGNIHPTVKPLALMRHLVRLVTPPGGLVLDPFAGSGTTLLAAQEEARRSIGVELKTEHAAIIRKRLAQDVLAFGVSAEPAGAG